MTHKHMCGEDWSVIARMIKTGFTEAKIARRITGIGTIFFYYPCSLLLRRRQQETILKLF